MNTKKDIRSFVLFFFGWWLYFTQGVLGIRGIISQVVLAIMLVWSFYYYIKVMLINGKNPVLKALSYIVIIFMIYGLANLWFSPQYADKAVDYVKKAGFSIFPIFGFYYFFRKIQVDEIWMIIIVIALMLFAIGEYIDGVRNMEKMIEEGVVRRSTDEMVIGSTYRFVPIIPLLFFITKREWFKYAALIVIFIFAVMGVKRGPILICGFSLVVMLWDNYKQFSLKKIRFAHIIVLATAVVVGYYVISRLIESNYYFMYRLEQTLEGDSSGRDIIYSNYFSFFLSERNPFKLIFGHGADSTLDILGGYAHNDWLEIALNQGILGFFFYFYYYLALVKQWRKSKPNHELFVCLGLFIIISFVTSMFSMSINNQRISAHVCLAYCLARVDQITSKKGIIR